MKIWRWLRQSKRIARLELRNEHIEDEITDWVGRLLQAQSVCNYLRGEVDKMADDVAWLPHYQEGVLRWQTESKRWEDKCTELRGEVERLEAENEKLIGLHAAHGEVIEHTDLDGNPVEYEEPHPLSYPGEVTHE